ncbi:hypothetical protein Zmor_011853 [Zophobas morio]|uniref:ABC transporter domain-containing protein n=1 Tax=Zophobas morio TaxID=2755281 RepID=A0AA38LZY8_9CUCU|nr:hypothetical protein Zmor_011853 [Zophobas morio]
MKSNETLIAVRDLISKKGTRSDGVKYSFEDINFNLKQGEILIIVGERGAGKTSLARSIIGLEKVSGGSVDFDDKLVIGGVPNFYLAGLKLMKDLKKIDRLITLSRRVAFEFLYGVKSQYFKYTKNMKYNKSTNEVTGYYDANYLDIDFNKDNIMDIIGTST